MADKITISLIPDYREHFPVVKEYLENQDFEIRVIDKNEIAKTESSDLSIFFINEINFDIIVFIENTFKNQPVILNYNHCPDEISIELFSKNLTFHKKQELITLPILIENALLKNQLLNIAVNNYEAKSPLSILLEKILKVNINKIQFDKYIEKVLSDVSKYAGADEFNFFVLPKFKNFNIGLNLNIIEKYDINKLNDLYPEIEYDSLINVLEKNQELIMFKKNGNVKTDVINDKTKRHYYSLIVAPIFINNVLYGCVLFNFHRAIENINTLRQDIHYISKFFSFQLQYKIVYSQYENSINQFSRLINNAVNGIYQSTAEGKIVYANPAFLKIIGYDSLDEIKKVDLFTELYTSKSDREKFIKKIKNEKAVQNYESVLKKKNGEIINILENSRTVDNQDGTILFEGIIQDITHQINLKEKLKYQTSFSEKIVENASFIIFAITEKNEVIMWNSMAEKITGYDRKEIYKDAALLKKIFVNLDSIKNHFLKIIQNKNDTIDSKYDILEILAKDGSKKIIRWSWSVTDYLSEKLKQVIGFGVDVTETMKLEEQLYESQKMESIGTLAAGMAYDFTSILNELNIYNSSLKSLVKQDSKEATYVGRIEDIINKASTFASKLIGLSKREKKKNIEIDVNNCINYVLDLFEHTVEDNVELEKDVCALPLINGDLSQIHQVILNVAINSNESISNNGRISFKSEIVMTKTDEYLNTINTEVKNYVKITISDNGKGIPSELHHRIFDPFFTTKASGKSAGLGLPVAYNIVKNHKGYIFVDSALDKGSNFYIYFPYVGERSKSFVPEISGEAVEKSRSNLKVKEKPQILVVDDEVIIRDLLNDILEDHNYDIILAKDGIEGFELYKKHKNSIDLVLLDIIMPGMTGKEVFEKIREINADAKVIITSGYSKQQITDSLMANGASGFLPKPFNIDKLLGLIKALVEEN
jgi:PAS domain S-box-containing protein